MIVLLALWALLQAATVFGVANYLRHIPRERLIEGPDGVVILASVHGPWPNASAFFDAMLRQDGVRPRLLIAISGPNDSAWNDLVACRDRHPDRIEIVAAGTSTTEGQKIHKLRTTIALLRPEDRYLVFIDTDYAPPARLIGRLLFPIVHSKTAISTGYRLLLPAPRHPLLALAAAVDIQVATLPRTQQGMLPWGGAMAMTRETFERLGIADAWRGRLSDDLTVARVARAANLGIRPVRDLLVGTPLDGGAKQAAAFAIRQYQHLFWNLPAMWAVAAAIVFVQLAGWTWAIACGGWPAIAIGYAAAWLRAGLRAAIVAQILPVAQARATRGALAWDCLAPLAVVAAHAACLFAAALSHTIRWGAFEYRMARDGSVERVARR